MAACQNTNRQIGHLHLSYQMDNRRAALTPSRNEVPSVNIYFHETTWFCKIYAAATGYAFPTNSDRFGVIYPALQKSRLFTCPGEERGGVDGLSIVPNELLNEEHQRQGTGFLFRSLDFRHGASKVLLCGDGNGYGIRYEAYVGPYGTPMFRHGSTYPTPRVREAFGGTPRGDGQAVLTFADGHVETFDPAKYTNAVASKSIILDFR